MKYTLDNSLKYTLMINWGGILIALILLSSLSFNGGNAATDSKILGQEEAAASSATPKTLDPNKQAPAATSPVATDSTK